jgi:hypothetical protein
LIRHINYHNYTIGWALFVPAMESVKVPVM